MKPVTAVADTNVIVLKMKASANPRMNSGEEVTISAEALEVRTTGAIRMQKNMRGVPFLLGSRPAPE